MKTSKSKGKWPPTNGNDDGDDKKMELLMKIIDLQSRCIEAMALAVGAMPTLDKDDEDDDEDEDDKETEE